MLLYFPSNRCICAKAAGAIKTVFVSSMRWKTAVTSIKHSARLLNHLSSCLLCSLPADFRPFTRWFPLWWRCPKTSRHPRSARTRSSGRWTQIGTVSCGRRSAVWLDTVWKLTAGRQKLSCSFHTLHVPAVARHRRYSGISDELYWFNALYTWFNYTSNWRVLKEKRCKCEWSWAA